MTWRVRYTITGEIEVEAANAEDAFDAATDMSTREILDETIGNSTVDFDEITCVS